MSTAPRRRASTKPGGKPANGKEQAEISAVEIPVPAPNGSGDRQPGLDPRAYNAAVAAAELESLRLHSSSFDVVREEGDDPGTYRTEIRSERSKLSVDEERGRVVISMRWTVIGHLPRRAARFEAVASFRLAYTGLSGVSEDILEALIPHLSSFSSYPYLRTYVSQVASLAGFSIPPLPMLKGQVKVPRPRGRVTVPEEGESRKA